MKSEIETSNIRWKTEKLKFQAFTRAFSIFDTERRPVFHSIYMMMTFSVDVWLKSAQCGEHRGEREILHRH